MEAGPEVTTVKRTKGKTLPWTITQGENVIRLDDKTANIMINMMHVLAHNAGGG